MKVLDVHTRSLETSTALSGYAMATQILPPDVISVLNRQRISFVLVGAHGLGGWTKKPRATQDIDVIVAAKHHKKAVKALLMAFPELEAEDHPVVTRLHRKGTREVAIDVMKPNQQLFREVFRHTHTVTLGKQSYRIPCLEMAIAMKFAPMVSLHRQDADKYLDAHDFMHMVQSNNEIDEEKLAHLGELVYPGGGKEILELVRRTRAGEKLNL
jgi:hypothetical protein